MPTDSWCRPGDVDCGLLGADVAHGYLHGLPSECCTTIGSSSVVTTRSLCSPFGYNDQAVLDTAAAAPAAATTTIPAYSTESKRLPEPPLPPNVHR